MRLLCIMLGLLMISFILLINIIIFLFVIVGCVCYSISYLTFVLFSLFLVVVQDKFSFGSIDINEHISSVVSHIFVIHLLGCIIIYNYFWLVI